MISLFPCAQRATLTKHFSGSIKDLEPRGTVVESYARGEGPMGLIAGFFVAAVLAGTGIYNPQLMHNGRCMAESGARNGGTCSSDTEVGRARGSPSSSGRPISRTAAIADRRQAFEAHANLALRVTGSRAIAHWRVRIDPEGTRLPGFF